LFFQKNRKKGISYLKIFSKATQRNYDPVRTAFINNVKLAALYLEHGIDLLDVFTDKSGRLVLAFDKDETQPLFRQWRESYKQDDGSPYSERKSGEVTSAETQ
jgi:hypothetical protein